MLSLYDRIDSLCKEKGTNITQMCKAAGVPRSALSEYKAGRNKTISFANLQKIADFFNMTVDGLVNGQENKKESLPQTEEDELNEYLEQLKNNPGMRMLFSKTKNASKEDIEKVIKMLDILRGDDGQDFY